MNDSVQRPVLGFRNASVNQQIDTCTRLAHGVATLSPGSGEQAHVQNLQQELAAAEAVRAELAEYRLLARAALAKQKAVMARLRNAATKCAVQVWAHAGAGEESGEKVLLQAGLTLAKSKRVSVGLPGVPTALRARVVSAGVELRWRTPMRRCWYLISYAEAGSGETQWVKHQDLWPVRGRAVLTELQPGRTYWLRVQAHNGHGEGGWSTMLQVSVPAVS